MLPLLLQVLYLGARSTALLQDDHGTFPARSLHYQACSNLEPNLQFLALFNFLIDRRLPT